MFPGSPLPHIDNDQWKHTMFTNLKLLFQVFVTSKLHINCKIGYINVIDMKQYKYVHFLNRDMKLKISSKKWKMFISNHSVFSIQCHLVQEHPCYWKWSSGFEFGDVHGVIVRGRLVIQVWTWVWAQS